MTRYQFLLLPAIAAAIFAAGGAFKHKTARAEAPVTDLAPCDPQALAVLDNAVVALSPERVSWLETLVWQQVRCEDFNYQARGRLLAAPQRMRLDLNVQVGKTLGELRVINDGTTLWESTQITGDAPTLRKWELPRTGEALRSDGEVSQARAGFLQARGFAGLAPMLSSLRHQMRCTQLKPGVWQGKPVHIVSGAWLNNAGAAPMTLDNTPPRFQMRYCRIYLDAESLWPHRIEWWGAEKPRDASELLIQTEFRDPILNRALSPERCALEFTMSVN